MSVDHDNVMVGAGPRAGADRPLGHDANPDPARWIEEHGDALFRFALVRLGDPNEAEEMVQECLLSALRGVETFVGQSTERTWLTSILKNKIVDYIRRTTRERSFKESQLDAKSGPFDDRGYWSLVPKRWREDPMAAIQQKEFGPVLLDCLGKLPAGMAEAIVLRELNQMSSDEVCESLAISVQTLWQRLHRARHGLRRCLELNWFDTTKRNRNVQ